MSGKTCRNLGALSIWPNNFETLKTWGLQENLIIDEFPECEPMTHISPKLIRFASGLYPCCGYTSKYTRINYGTRIEDGLPWVNITPDSTDPLHELLPHQRSRSLRKRGSPYIMPRVRIERHKRCFMNKCLFSFIKLIFIHL